MYKLFHLQILQFELIKLFVIFYKDYSMKFIIHMFFFIEVTSIFH